MKPARLFILSVFILTGAPGRSEDVPGRWGTTDTSRPENIEWPESWAGAKNLRAQWFKILAEGPRDWKASGFLNHAKGEPPDNTYYLWRYDRPLPEGTKILIEGDFPHARMMSFQVSAPWNGQSLVSSDGTGLPEIHLLDEDIVPDPGHTNPFLPGADRRARKRHFHLTFELKDGDPVSLNPQAAVPPYRAAGNLRVGATGTAEPGAVFGGPKRWGPAVYVRIYLPDGYDPFGGVEPPVIRLQLPGKKPELAPISRAMPVNLRQFVKDYSLAENPALDNGRSVKEEEALGLLREYARNAAAGGPAAPRAASPLLSTEGVLHLYKSFQTPYLVTFFKDYLFQRDWKGCRETLPSRYGRAFGRMGPDASPPGNDEHVSNHHIFNTYLVGALDPAPGQWLGIHGKAPRVPRTLGGNPVMEPSDQLRYWNITLQAGRPTRLTPVVNITDEQAAVDGEGNFTVLVGTETGRPAGLSPSVTWMTKPVEGGLSVNMRIMSTARKTWEKAPQLVTWREADYCVPNQNPEAVRARMGEYYPEFRLLTKAQAGALIAGKTWKEAVAGGPSRIEAVPGDHDAVLSVDGRRRTYRVHAPPSFRPDRAMPLVIVLHGGRTTGVQMQRLTGLAEAADRKGFIAVFPDAAGIYKGERYWNDGRVPEVDDVAFIRALIDEMVRAWNVDPGRVFVTGHSNGASMTTRLGIQLGDKIAAIAPVAGTLGVRVVDQWKPLRPMPVVYFHGVDDPMAYYTGGSAGTRRGSALSAEGYVDWWAEKNGCGKVPGSTVLPAGVKDGTVVTRIDYPCPAKADVTFYKIEGGGHTWPGRVGILPEKPFGKTTANLDANEIMWDFFQNQAKAGRP